MPQPHNRRQHHFVTRLAGRRRGGRPSVRSVLLIAATALALVATATAPATAAPQKPKLTAIEAMPSKLSSLRRNASGQQMTQQERDTAIADTNAALGNSDLMGTPANKTVVESDQVLRETNTSGADFNQTTVAAFALKDDMTGITTVPPDAPLAQRAVISHNYPSAGGHFLDATHMGVLEFKHQVAGNDALLSLTSPNQAAESGWTLSSTVTTPDPLMTYAFVQGTGANRTALTNSATIGSDGVGTQLRSEPFVSGIPAANQLWTVVDAGYHDGSFSVVSRADGLCLAWSGQVVTIDTCIDNVSRHWKYNNDPSNNAWIFPASENSQASIGSDGGYGVAKTLGANTTQTWSAFPLQEPAGSIQSWSTLLPGGFSSSNSSAAYDMAVGDLDGMPTKSFTDVLAYHDESAIAWADADGNVQVRVFDYNANDSRQLISSASIKASVGANGPLGDVLVGIGDFNGDGHNELAVAYQDSNYDFTFAFYTYTAAADGTRTLAATTCTTCQGAQPFTGASNISQENGYADLVTGDFDGDASDDIAIGFATYASSTNNDRFANLGVWTMDSTLKTRSVGIHPMTFPSGATLPRALDDGNRRGSSGIKLAAGNFLANPAAGFGPQRSEIAIAYDEYTVGKPDSGLRSYVIKPVVNIYAVSSDCNSSGGNCSADFEPTSGTEAPTALFKSHPTQTTYEPLGTSFNAAPLSLAAGGFGGTGQSDPPVDGLLASTWLEWKTLNSQNGEHYLQETIVVPWVAKDTTFNQCNIYDSQTKLDDNVAEQNWVLTHYTAYDRAGASLVLGAPAVLSIEQDDHMVLVAGQPPGHVDWLPDSTGTGGWVNPSASGSFYLQAGTTSTSTVASSGTRQNTWSNTVSEGADVKVSWSTDDFVSQEKASLDISQKFNKQWSGLDQDTTDANMSFSKGAQVQTNSDDAITYTTDDSLLYRYPVIGGPGQFTTDSGTCASGCRAYYDVAVPQGSTFQQLTGGQTTDIFNPSWENLNALSYPTLVGGSNPVPMPDLGNYSYVDASGNTIVQNGALYNASTAISGNSGQITLSLANSTSKGNTSSSTRSWANSLDVTAHGNISAGPWASVGGFGASLDLTASLGWDTSKGTESQTMGSNSTSTDTSFVLNHPTVDPSVGYFVGTAFYYASDGSAKVVHGVDLQSNPQGRSWWLDHYGDTPDPSLNLPGRIYLAFNTTDSSNDSPKWLTTAQRQKMRQFAVLQYDDDGSGLDTAGDAYTNNPAAGQRVQFSVVVHNYSLKAMTNPTTATWYAVPTDGSDYNVVGAPIEIGDSTVPAMGAQGAETVLSPVWKALAGTGNVAQQYRIFVRLDEAGTADDMHPLMGAACPTDTLDPSNADSGKTPALYDAMALNHDTTPDPLGCGQNNQGYGLVTINPAGVGVVLADSKHPARAQLDGAGLIDGDSSHLRLTTKSDVPTIPVDEQVTGMVFAKADLLTDDHPTVAIYDGPVSKGKVIAIKRLNGIDPTNGGAVQFTWTPTTPGLHELHQVLLGTSSTGQDDEQIMRVNVAEPLEQYTVKAAASASSVAVGAPYSISGTISPVPSGSYPRTVQLQVKDGKQWKTIDSQETSSKGAFAFDLTGDKAGTLTYRVHKVATLGRYAADAPELTVTVGAFVVTVKASSTNVDPGRVVTFTGTVQPPLANPSDGTVDLEIKDGTAWKAVATGQANETGAFTLTTTPKTKGSYSYRVTKRATPGLPAASSPPVNVTVSAPFTLSAKASPSSVKKGKAATISGKVTPSMPSSADRKVKVQVLSGKTWKDVAKATATTASSGAYSIRVTPGAKGSNRYRVVKLATSGKKTAYSREVTVKRTS